MLDISSRLKNLFESGDDVNTLNHTLLFTDLETDEEISVIEGIKPITEDIKIDGQPIGKFPIGMIEFEISGDLTNRLKTDGQYEVKVIDTYRFDDVDSEEIINKSYLITEIEYKRESRSTFFKGYDYGSKLSVEYDESLYSLPLTFSEFTTQFYNNHGLEVKNIGNLFQGDYQLKVVPTYDTGVLSLQVARDIAKFSLSTQYIGRDNKVKIVDAQDMMGLPIGEVSSYKSFKSLPNNFKTLGINTLVLGLQGDIDGENVSRSDLSAINIDGSIELRLDAIPFVYNQTLKEEVIDNMFEHIMGFHYNSFESEGINFYFELGDVVQQIGQDEDGGDYPILILESHVTKDGSMMTRHSSESKSVQETQMKWEDFTDKKRTEIMVDKANQKIDLAVEKVDLQEDKISALRLDLEGIEAEVGNVRNDYNRIPNIDGSFEDFTFWSWKNTDKLTFSTNKHFKRNLQFGTNFEIVEFPESISGIGLSFHGNGEAITGFGRLVEGEKHSFRVRRLGGTVKPFTIKVMEYDEHEVFIKETPFLLNSKEYEEFSLITSPTSRQAKLSFVISGVSLTDRLDLTEIMFNYGEPLQWQETPNDLKVWTMSQLKLRDDEIQSNVEEIRIVDGKTVTNKSSITQNAQQIALKASRIELDGKVSFSDLNVKGKTVISGDNITTGTIKANRLELSDYAKFSNLTDGSTVISGSNIKTGTISASRINFDGATGNNVDLTGAIHAEIGRIGGWDIDGEDLVSRSGTRDKDYVRIRGGGTDSANALLWSGSREPGNAPVYISKGGRALFQEIFPSGGNKQLGSNGINRWSSMYLHNGYMSGSLDVNVLRPDRQTEWSGFGADDNRYNSIYLKNSPNVSSDLRIKDFIQDIPKTLVERLVELKPKMYQQKHDGKWHFGYLAQDVERIIYKETVEMYGWEEAKDIQSKFAVIEKGESHLSLLYGEIAVLKDAYYMDRIDDLQSQMNKLKEMMNNGL